MDIMRVLEPGQCLTTAEMMERTGYTRRDVAKGCVPLLERGWIDRLERGCFILSEEGRRARAAGETITSGPRRPLTQVARRPRRRTVQDKMWSTIRVSRKFDLARLEEMAGASTAGARRFVLALARAGYLTELRRQSGEAPTSNGFKRWLLIEDPGPATPVLKADGRVWDPNLGVFRGAAR
ncbi:hypothetical protein [Azorhizobium sp. AG788]|uniref:hypothetical protein n=1 Tax=Azorhizobium sp. AG788 TaxID=2183897 RepID=UPI00313A306C